MRTCAEPCPRHADAICSEERHSSREIARAERSGQTLLGAHVPHDHHHEDPASRRVGSSSNWIGRVVHRWSLPTEPMAAGGHQSFTLEPLGADPREIKEGEYDKLYAPVSRSTMDEEAMPTKKGPKSETTPNATAKAAGKAPARPAKAKAPTKAKRSTKATKEGGPRRQSKWSPEDIANVRRLHGKEGKSISEIHEDSKNWSSRKTKIPMGTIGGMIFRYASYAGARPGATN